MHASIILEYNSVLPFILEYLEMKLDVFFVTLVTHQEKPTIVIGIDKLLKEEIWGALIEAGN
jgi:hypothetical protein